MRKIYLDHQSATKPHLSSIEAWLTFLKELWGTSVAPHQMGQELFPFLNASTKAICEVLGGGVHDLFYFFSSNVEAIHHLYHSHYSQEMKPTGKTHFLTSNVEEAPILLSLERWEALGCTTKMLPVNSQGQLTKEQLREAIGPRTSLVSISWANALTGVIQPIADLAEVCREKGVKFHLDASAVIGKLYFRFEDLDVDFLSFEGSVLHAPKGTAGLLFKDSSSLAVPVSLMTGVNVGGVVALSNALQKNQDRFEETCLETARLRDEFERQIKQLIPDARVLFEDVERLSYCSCIAFPGVVNDALLYLLHLNGVYASLGGGRCQRLFHVLVGSCLDETLAQTALSFSFSFETTEEEVKEAVRIIASCVEKLTICSHHLMEGL